MKIDLLRNSVAICYVAPIVRGVGIAYCSAHTLPLRVIAAVSAIIVEQGVVNRLVLQRLSLNKLLSDDVQLISGLVALTAYKLYRLPNFAITAAQASLKGGVLGVVWTAARISLFCNLQPNWPQQKTPLAFDLISLGVYTGTLVITQNHFIAVALSSLIDLIIYRITTNYFTQAMPTEKAAVRREMINSPPLSQEVAAINLDPEIEQLKGLVRELSALLRERDGNYLDQHSTNFIMRNFLKCYEKVNSTTTFLRPKEHTRVIAHYVQYYISKLKNEGFDLDRAFLATKASEITVRLPCTPEAREAMDSLFCSMDFRYFHCTTAVIYVAMSSSVDTKWLEYFIDEKKEDINAFELLMGNTALQWAIANAVSDKAIFMIKRWKNQIHFDFQDSVTRGTALHLAIRKGRRNARWDELADLLIENTNGNIQDEEGNTALHFAYARRDIEWINKLQAKGADPSIKNREDKTPLEMWNLSQDEFKSFISCGASSGEYTLTFDLKDRARREGLLHTVINQAKATSER